MESIRNIAENMVCSMASISQYEAIKVFWSNLPEKMLNLGVRIL